MSISETVAVSSSKVLTFRSSLLDDKFPRANLLTHNAEWEICWIVKKTSHYLRICWLESRLRHEFDVARPEPRFEQVALADVVGLQYLV